MYYRKTKNKIIACVLLLFVVMCVPAKKYVFADTQSKFVFSPLTIVGFANRECDNSDTERVEIGSVNGEAKSDIKTEEDSYNNNGRILIYHTHTNEAYLTSEEERNVKLASRSSDAAFTVQAVGSAMQDSFAKLGIDSDHDTSNNEAQGYSKAYTMSHISVADMIEANGEYAVYLDVHRDAYASGTAPTVTINGESVARVMLVIGGRSSHAEQNHAFAQRVMERLNKIHPQLCEKVLYVQSSKYNNIEADNCAIVEIGDNNVTVEEASRAAAYVALAVSMVINNN